MTNCFSCIDLDSMVERNVRIFEDMWQASEMIYIFF